MNILIADSHTIVRQGLRSLLEQTRDIRVVAEAHDGTSLLSLVREHQPDVVVTEIMLPKVSGLEAARIIMAEGLRSQVLFLTSRGEKEMVSAALDTGARGYILKDTDFRHLVEGIRAVHALENYLGPKVLEIFLAPVAHPPVASSRPELLTAREQEILMLIADGKTSKDIAFLLGISNKTVDTFRRHCMKKLQLNTNADLTKYAIRQGMVTL